MVKRFTDLPEIIELTANDVIAVVDVETNTSSIITANNLSNTMGIANLIIDLNTLNNNFIANSSALANSISSITIFLPTCNNFYEDDNYFYMGYTEINGSWLIRQQSRTNSSSLNANSINNAGYVYANAWTNKEILTYN